MEDDKLKELFGNFEPDISSDYLFMNRLERKLDSVEIIKQHNAEVRSRNKKALAIAAFAGFIAGFLFSLMLPYLSNSVSAWRHTMPDESFMNAFADNFYLVAWTLIGGTSVFLAINTYELSLSLLRNNSRHNS